MFRAICRSDMTLPMANKTKTDFALGRDFVQSLARGLSVLRSFDGDHPTLSLAAIAQRTGLSRAAARRLVLTLSHLGYLRPNDRGFALSARVLELGFGYLGTLNFSDLAQPLVEDLARRIGQSCSMAVLDAQHIVYVVRVPVRRVMTVSLGIGARLPTATTSMGRVLVAGLSPSMQRAWLKDWHPARHTAHTVIKPARLRAVIEQVREQGYAWVEQELELGLCSLAVPVRNPEGQVAIALNTSMVFYPDAARDARKRLLPLLRKTATALEACLPGKLLPGVSA
jgi:IclR family pca regulon transcriptional regulator